MTIAQEILSKAGKLGLVPQMREVHTQDGNIFQRLYWVRPVKDTKETKVVASSENEIAETKNDSQNDFLDKLNKVGSYEMHVTDRTFTDEQINRIKELARAKGYDSLVEAINNPLTKYTGIANTLRRCLNNDVDLSVIADSHWKGKLTKLQKKEQAEKKKEENQATGNAKKERAKFISEVKSVLQSKSAVDIQRELNAKKSQMTLYEKKIDKEDISKDGARAVKAIQAYRERLKKLTDEYNIYKDMFEDYRKKNIKKICADYDDNSECGARLANYIQDEATDEEKEKIIKYANKLLETHSWITPKEGKLDTSRRGLRIAEDIIHKAQATPQEVINTIPKVKNYKSVDECTNFTKLHAYMHDKYGITIDPAVKYLNFEYCKEATKGIEYMLKKYPKLKEYTSRLSYTTSQTAFMSASSISGSINFNSTTFAKSNGNLPFARNAGAHEMGHIFEFYMAELAMENSNASFDSLYASHARATVMKAWDNLSDNEQAQFGYDIENGRQNISKYAMKDLHETIAEATGNDFEMYKPPLGEKPLAREICKVLTQEYNAKFNIKRGS